ncbi:carbonic anhydrase [Aristophania vespae]|uniref:carbonic anhydrase n=1 Tax=Aristophania vespae TaxID=2697033 RepID=UPI0023517652|nr:carbonic anhydrase [Aristophania vespae]UMM64574.1 Carbonic anhydrase 1 [Aristophania vespae]
MAFNKNSLIEVLEGVCKFEDEVYPQNKDLFQSLAYDQSPPVLFITCADSRISPGMITQTEPGELFIIRNVGNIVPAYGEMVGGVSSAIEYALGILKVKNIIICGHSNCGAMHALLDLNSEKLNTMPTVRRWLMSAEAARAQFSDLRAEDAGPKDVQSLTEANILLQLTHLKTHPAVAKALSRNEVSIEGWYYDIKNGKISVIDEDTGKFIPSKEMLKILKTRKNSKK